MKIMQLPSKSSKPTRDGFSLVEVMMVVMLVGILAGVSAPPMFKYLEANHMQTRADRMVADLQYARAVAISTGQAHRFASTNTSYTVKNLATGVVLRDVEFDHGSELDMMQFSDFYPWGMSSGGTFTLSLHGMQRRISILPTGMVEVEIP